MACSLTVDAVQARQKTVTRRHANTWGELKRGDHLTLVEKGMGLKKGEKQVVLAEVEIIDNRVEPLVWIDEDDCRREGFPDMTPSDFIDMWCESHHIDFRDQDEAMKYLVRRISWRYLDDARTGHAPTDESEGVRTRGQWPVSAGDRCVHDADHSTTGGLCDICRLPRGDG